MSNTDHIARREHEAGWTLRHAPGLEWARIAYSGVFRRLAAAAGRHGTVEQYIGACAASPLGLAARVYLDIYPTEPVTAVPNDVRRYWNAVFVTCGHPMDDPVVAAAFVKAALAVWADVGPQT